MSITKVKSEAYGIDRAAFNQGANAQYDFAIEDNISPPPCSKRTGCSVYAAFGEVIGALCARDYKGVGSQYVQDNKLVLSPAPQGKEVT